MIGSDTSGKDFPKILRSVISVEKTDNEEALFENLGFLQESNLVFPSEEQNQIWDFIKTFAKDRGHAPDMFTVSNFFLGQEKSEIYDWLNSVVIVLRPITRGDFEVLVRARVDDQRRMEFRDLLEEAKKINSRGRKIKEGRKERIILGPRDACQYVISKSHRIITPVGGVKMSGELNKDMEDFQKEYEYKEANPDLRKGRLTGLAQMDKALGGVRKGQLWVHSAFVGHLKSTFLLNWAYTQSIWYGYSTVIFELEMPYSQTRYNHYALHTIHPKFTDVRIHLGLQKPDEDPVGLDSRKIRDAILDPAEREFLFGYVLPDLKNEKNGYGNIHIETVSQGRSRMTVADMQAQAEIIHSKTPIHMLGVDHGLLVAPETNYRNTTENANEVVRDLKLLSLSFNRGEMIPVVDLHQMSRKGYLKAKDKEGLYDATALTYSNEVEKSADVITAAFCEGKMKEDGMILFQNLKARDDRTFAPFYARIEWGPKRLFTCYDQLNMNEDEQEEMATIVEGSLDENFDELLSG